ncbi:MAG: hypothetical protein WAS27_02760 [Candidatus Saccharimonadales bacterium]
MREQGDTIIEVLFAVMVFSLVAVGGLSIMNQGVAMAQRSLEIGLVRQQIDEQADALRYLNQAYVAGYGKYGEATERWSRVIGESAVTRAQDFDTMTSEDTCQLPSGGSQLFALDIMKLNATNNAQKIIPTADVATYAQVRRDTGGNARAEGIWIQAVRSPVQDNRPGSYDFHIRACWKTPGQATPVTLGTIVRLYEPRG